VKTKATAAKPKRKSTKQRNGLEGSRAPEFTLAGPGGTTVTLASLIGRRNLVLYFYPKDMTPGCTAEACGFRDDLARIRRVGATVVGISSDSTASHQKFAEKHSLNFTLLSDPDHPVARRYGVYKKKSLYGREFMGIERTTFVIDKTGLIRKVFPKVKVNGHTEQVIEELKKLK